jgi:hypothetical protein
MAKFLQNTMGAVSSPLTAAVTGPPPKNYDFKSRVIGGSGSPHGSPLGSLVWSLSRKGDKPQ